MEGDGGGSAAYRIGGRFRAVRNAMAATEQPGADLNGPAYAGERDDLGVLGVHDRGVLSGGLAAFVIWVWVPAWPNLVWVLADDLADMPCYPARCGMAMHHERHGIPANPEIARDIAAFRAALANFCFDVFWVHCCFPYVAPYSCYNYRLYVAGCQAIYSARTVTHSAHAQR